MTINPVTIDPVTIRRIAKLARLHVAESDVTRLQGELGGILGWIEQLNEVNVQGVEPLTGAMQMALKMRDDVVTDGGIVNQILQNAPERAENFFAVPKVVE